MPFTLFHYPFGYGISKISKNLSLPGLLVGAVIPDIEVPILALFFEGVYPDHFILHSLVGALSIGLVLSILTTRYLYTPLIGFFFKLDRDKLAEKCAITPYLVLSAILGIISHLGVDLLHHWYNPILWPFIPDPYALVGPLVIVFANLLNTDILTGYFVTNLLTHVVMIPIFLAILVRNGEDRWQRIWIGD